MRATVSSLRDTRPMREVVRIAAVLATLSCAVAAAQEPEQRIRRAQLAIASTLDPALPDVPLAIWLRHVVGPFASYEWTTGSCAGARARDNAAVPLCAIVAVADANVTVIVGVRLGEYLQDAKTDRWATPRLDGAFLSRGRRVLMLDRLSDLPGILELPLDRWPATDVVLESVRCTPERPQPDDHVTCALTLLNRGDAPSLARIFLDVASDRSRGGDGAIGLQSGERRTVRMMFPWPDEDGAVVTAGVELTDRTPYHRVDDRGAVALTRGEDLDTPAELLGWDDDDNAPAIIVSARRMADGAPQVIDVPVDGSISKLVVSVESLPGIAATLLRPGGALVGEMDGDVALSVQKTMDLQRRTPADLRVFAIARPQPGIWKIVVDGRSAAAASAIVVKAVGYSSIAFGSFRFVRRQEGVHGGYFEIDGMPLSGAPATARADLWGGPDDATFRLVDDAGVELQVLALRKGLPDTARDEFLGTFGLPAVPFHVVMDAIDASGAHIQRQYPVMFRAQPVAVFFHHGQSNAIAAGTGRRFRFAVTNVGTESATFALDVRTTLGQVVDLSPPAVTVEPGTSALVSFSLSIPAEAVPPCFIHLRMTATETTDPAVMNSASAELELSRPDDADNDYVPDAIDNCPEVPNHSQIDQDGNGIGDECDRADGGPLSIRRLSPESGPPGTVVRISGTGFSPTGPNIVLFDGVPAAAAAVNATELAVTVPAGVAIGPVLLMVATEKGFAMSPMPFVVRRPPGRTIDRPLGRAPGSGIGSRTTAGTSGRHAPAAIIRSPSNKAGS